MAFDEREADRERHPSRYPPRQAGETREEYWAHWTPHRLEQWRFVEYHRAETRRRNK